MSWKYNPNGTEVTVYAPSGTEVGTVEFSGSWTGDYPDVIMQPALLYVLDQWGNLNVSTAIDWLGQLIVEDIEEGKPD